MFKGDQIAAEFKFMKRRLNLVLRFSAWWLFIPGIVCAQWNPLNPVVSVQRESDGVQLKLQSGTLKLQVCSDSIIRVRYSLAAAFPSRPEFVVIKDNWPAAKWEMQTSDDAIVLSTFRVKVFIARKDISVTFRDSGGKSLFVQSEVSMTPTTVNGEQT